MVGVGDALALLIGDRHREGCLADRVSARCVSGFLAKLFRRREEAISILRRDGVWSGDHFGAERGETPDGVQGTAD